ncbi:MAG: Regulatory protein AtoC [Myxococcota bacterium]|nr:Regulatory protein AtoC [Myxococcota bacterium]
MNGNKRVLVIEDNDTMREGIVKTLEKMDLQVVAARSGRDGLDAWRANRADVVITDYKMEGMDGLEVIRAVRELDDSALIIMITAFGTIETAVSAMKEGAADFITKPFPPDVLRVRVQRVLEMGDMRREQERLRETNRMLTAEHAAERGLDDVVGKSEKMNRVMETVRKVAGADSSVLIMGESGTGKELVAHAVHKLSPRANGPFIRVNCGALTETLLESELFGHEKGSFTGAIKRKLGRFELADRGTLFLDEIGEISPAMQVKLLRVLQEREFERVGGEETIRVDARIIAATNRDLKKEVEAGKFREDLFYRLHIVPIRLPPLRERKEDIPLLVNYFITRLRERTHKQIAGISPEAMARLQDYHWPGNVREVQNIVEHMMVFCEGARIEIRDLPPFIRGEETGGVKVEEMVKLGEEDIPLDRILEDLERQLILKAFEKARGVKTETARILGIKPSALYYKLEKYGII